MTELTLKINGEDVTADVETRLSLADFIRDHRRLTGTHLGCEHGVCGACTVLMNGEPVRSCITFAVVADGTEITTIEGFEDDDPMTLLRQAFHENHALQCGYCTPGMLVAAAISSPACRMPMKTASDWSSPATCAAAPGMLGS